MPKGAPSASRVMTGGRSPRYADGEQTACGRRRSSHRLTTAVAVCISMQLELCCHHWQLSLVSCIAEVLEDKRTLRLFMAGTAVSAAAKSVREAAHEYLRDKSDKLAAVPDHDQPRKYAILVEVRERLRAHTGPPRRMADAPDEPPAPPRIAHDGWLDEAAPPMPRPLPPPDSRLRKRMRLWNAEGPHRAGAIPPHAVVVFERAEGRVRRWRNDTGAHEDAPPPVALLRALFHTDHVPTALTGDNDHFWLPALDRWASVTETLRLFGAPPDHPITRAMVAPSVPAASAITMLGRSVSVPSAERALLLALFAMPRDRPTRYASACSGVDMVAVALDSLCAISWEYVFASETRGDVADVLHAAHAPRGLTREAIYADALSPEATTLAPPCDIWVATPPCESYSRRNQSRSVDGQVAAASDFDLMLMYPRTHRPLAILVENVDEPESRSSIAAAVLSIEGYDWETFPSDAAEYGPMARKRRFWVGLKEA